MSDELSRQFKTDLSKLVRQYEAHGLDSDTIQDELSDYETLLAATTHK
jgi:hypothetical protein